MPNRILRDWTDSAPVNSLTVHAERHLVRIIMKADDFGRLTANPKLLRPMLYPLILEQVREADVQRWTAECEKAGLVRLYAVEDKEYLEVLKFGQRLRAKKSKFPKPPPGMTDNRRSHDGHMSVIRRQESLVGGERRESLSESLNDETTKATATTLRAEGKTPNPPPGDGLSSLVDEVVRVLNDEKSRVFWRKMVGQLGEGMTRELLGEVKMRRESLRSKAAWAAKTAIDWASSLSRRS